MGTESLLHDEEMITRAKRAWFAECRREGVAGDIPTSTSGVRWVGDMEYVVLENVRGVLAVYRVRKFDGKLKRLKRWPKEFGE